MINHRSSLRRHDGITYPLTDLYVDPETFLVREARGEVSGHDVMASGRFAERTCWIWWLASFRSPPSKRRTSPPEQRTPCGDRILQLKIALEGVRPQVWRRLLVPERMTLGTLSKTLERVMGWESYHLHEFEIDGISYGTPELDYPSDVRNERGRKLANFDFAEQKSAER